MTSLINADHGHHDPHIGYSFAKFSGPVSGNNKKKIQKDWLIIKFTLRPRQRSCHAWWASRTPSWLCCQTRLSVWIWCVNFNYLIIKKKINEIFLGVEDPKSQVSQFRKENRQDDAVVGEYSYTDPFGHVRTVKYTADKLHGFRADIYVDGKLETPHVPQAPENHHHTLAHHENNANDEDYSESSENDY